MLAERSVCAVCVFGALCTAEALRGGVRSVACLSAAVAADDVAVISESRRAAASCREGMIKVCIRVYR